MSEAFKRYVEVGRAVLLRGGKYDNKIAFIVEIIDHNRALVEGPTTGVTRHVALYKNLELTGHVIKKLPRAVRSKALKKFIEKSDVLSKWTASAWAKKIESRTRRTTLTDFERFKVMRLKKQRAILVNQQVKLLAKQSA